ncbi:dihydropteroate synthase [Pseudoalteromonas xiamenensis]|uniref:dihydropteroate synthase n=1 Tax=Pseudoalteromonas xiamenensis TaxID=882626 RepID=UPI0035E50A14
MFTLQLPRGRTLSLARPIVMGILNVTPDSFSDGGKFNQIDNAVKQALVLLDEGAQIIDIGGESTRPGAPDVSLQDELQRVIPVVKALRALSDCVISIDTSKPEVMAQAIEAGADIINDVRALQEVGALAVLARYPDVPVCLMHMKGAPRTMQVAPQYDNLLAEIQAFLEARIEACVSAGIQRQRIILDPGFGFGKTLKHNFDLLGQFEAFEQQKLPVLAGLSRKSMFGQLLSRDANERLAASLAGAMLCAQKGAHIIRVHDVKETVDVLNVLHAACNGVEHE